MSRCTPETFSHPLQSREKRELNRRAGHGIARRKRPAESRSLHFRRLPEIILVDETRQAVVTHACARQEGMRDLHMTNSTRAPSSLPSLLTLMAQGHTRVLLLSFLPANICLPACLSVRPSVHPYVLFILFAFVLSSVWAIHLLPHRRNLSFRMLSRIPPEASLSYSYYSPPRMRNRALSFLRATRD